MTVVIDVGAARYEDYFSMERLIDEYRPTHLYAYDPNPVLELPETGRTKVELIRSAAWTYTGMVGYRVNGENSELTADPEAPQVPCVDLADEIKRLSKRYKGRLILKLDCEGAEYEILTHLIARDADLLLDSVWVEWHPWKKPDMELVRAVIEETVRCDLREWWF